MNLDLPPHFAARAASPERLGLVLIGGFLGSGKTTLLNRLLERHDGADTAVLVNDFGDLNIDAQLIREVRGKTLHLESGCICCSIRDDLVTELLHLRAHHPEVRRVFVEASGLSDIGNILRSLSLSATRHVLRLEHVLAVVDGACVPSGLPAEARALVARQARDAWLVVLNRSDLAGPRQLTAARLWLEQHAPATPFIVCAEGNVPADLLLGGEPQHDWPLPGTAAAVPGFESLSLRLDGPLVRDALLATLERWQAVVRSKGIVQLADVPRLRTVLQGVGRYRSLRTEGAWGNRPAHSELVLIWCAGSIEPARLQRELEACQA